MGRYVTVNTWIDVDVGMDVIDTDDLIEELESRGESVAGLEPTDLKELTERLWIKRRNGQEYQQELDELIYNVIGRIA
jgi:hypothetical protein